MGKTRFQLESDVENYLVKRCAANGMLCIKLSPESNRGIPDRMIVCDGAIVFVELKNGSDGVPSPSQLVRHEELRRLGQNVAIVRSKKDADDLLKLIRE